METISETPRERWLREREERENERQAGYYAACEDCGLEGIASARQLKDGMLACRDCWTESMRRP